MESELLVAAPDDLALLLVGTLLVGTLLVGTVLVGTPLVVPVQPVSRVSVAPSTSHRHRIRRMLSRIQRRR
jgi:hypothetical protein